MKTRKIASMTSSLLSLIMTALILLATTACEKDPQLYHEDFTETDTPYSQNVMTENFWIHPDGGTLTLLGGVLEIIIPEDAVTSSTEFNIASFPVHHLDLDGYNMYDRGFSLTGVSSDKVFPNGITFKIKYDLNEDNWLKGLPANEEELQIFWVSPTLYSYERIVPALECCVDCSCKVIKGCIGKCGFYVVGEN
jgi:hypothetical protein